MLQLIEEQANKPMEAVRSLKPTAREDVSPSPAILNARIEERTHPKHKILCKGMLCTFSIPTGLQHFLRLFAKQAGLSGATELLALTYFCSLPPWGRKCS